MPSFQFKGLVSGTAPVLYPTDTFFGLLYYDAEEALELPKKYPYQGEWGQPISTHLLEREDYPAPHVLDIVWLSIVERKFYSLVSPLPVEKIEELLERVDVETKEPLFEHIVVGMAPYGGVAVWTHGFRKASLVSWMHAEETQVEMKDFMPLNPNVTLDENCDFYINNDPRVKKNLETYGLPRRDIFDNYMRQFTYRYLPLFEQWKSDDNVWEKLEVDNDIVTPEFDYIEESLYDGTHDKLHDGGLQKYREAGKPKKLALHWHVVKSDYIAYFWFAEEEIRDTFNRFFGLHPDTKTDFIIRIDSEKNKYELALYRYGLPEPRIIDDSIYQLIVFKNGFEYFRSNNYNQPHGAWIW